MKLTKEQIAAKRDFIVKGMHIVSDCAIRTDYEQPRSDLRADPQTSRRAQAGNAPIRISGIAATPHADLQGHILLGGAIDVTQRGVKLCLEHGRQVGEVLNMLYVGNELHIVAETDDADALKLNFFSVCGKPLHREQQGNYWQVSKMRLDEISLVKVPQNDRCLVLERKAADPFRALHLTRMRELELFKQAFDVVARGLQLLVVRS